MEAKMDLGNLLQQYLGGPAQVDPNQASYDFERIADESSEDDLAPGISEALRSDQTPPFPQLVSQLYDQGNPHERAGMLNQLLGSVGPGVLSSIAGGVLGSIFQNRGQQPQVTPEMAQQVTPQQVQQIAEGAEQQNPGVVDQMGNFYARNPTLVKALGGAALAIALGHMAKGMRR
jgi:hypothetical protein